MSRKILILALLPGLLLASACNDDDDCVNCSGDGTPFPTMANIWPHADGSAWTFGLEYRELEPEPGTGAKVGEIPTMEELHAALQVPMDGIVTDEGEGYYRFALDGTVTTRSGAVAQQVVESFFMETPTKTVRREGPASSASDRVLAIIAEYGLEKAGFSNYAPYFLSGYAFAYEDSGYYGYGDIDQNHSWVYLEGDLRPGAEFSFQLAAGLTNEVWLHGRVWSVGRRTFGGRTYSNVLECMYVLDFGEMYIRTAYDP